MLRKSAIFAFSVLFGVSAFGQSGTQWRTRADVVEGVRGTIVGTVSDLEPGHNRFTVSPDDDRNGTVTVDTDSVSTQFNGFGGTINGAPEVFVGSTGYSNVRIGDRVEVRGNGRAGGVVGADYVTLLGRPVPADQTGVGQTRTPDRISPPTASGTTPAGPTPQATGPIEGVVRQVNAADGRIVIETDRREMITVRGTTSTPVYYRNNVYRIGNLEPGDRIRIQPNNAVGGELRARTIDVIQNVQESGSATVQVGGMTGRVMTIDRRGNTVRVQNEKGDTVVVDLTNAQDVDGRRVRAADMQVGDHLDLSGSYVGDAFVATTVRFIDEGGTPPPAGPGPVPYPGPAAGPLGSVTIYGTVTQSLANSSRLVVRDQAGATIPLYVLDDFTVHTRAGGYTTADRLREGDSLIVKAYRDSDGNYIAQTIRIR